MKRILRRLAVAALAVAPLTLLSTPVPAQAPARAFVDGFDDLPLMPALTQEPDSLTVFESPYGRIVEAYASGRATAQAVRAFYAATLPQLGWTPAAADTWTRESEVLTLDVESRKDAVTVRFQVSPPG